MSLAPAGQIPTPGWLAGLIDLGRRDGGVARVTIVVARGPTPREIGAAMLVTPTAREGKIGRGRLEEQAIAAARRMLGEIASFGHTARWRREVVAFETGPVLGESSGGQISVLIEVLGAAELADLCERQQGRTIVARALTGGTPMALLGDDERPVGVPPAVVAAVSALQRDPSRARVITASDDALADGWLVERLVARAVPFHVYGTGLVARALVRALDGLPFEVIWIDTDPAHFPPLVPQHVAPVAAADPAEIARAAQPGAFHAVMTVSHDLDYAVCRALLKRNEFGFAGVIGSRMKRKRLMARLAVDGIADDVLARMICPIGLPGIKSKQPSAIAISIAAQALMALGKGP